jgi:hypothetical protein
MSTQDIFEQKGGTAQPEMEEHIIFNKFYL